MIDLIKDYAEREYYRNIYLAAIFRKERNFNTAYKYYLAASIHLKYYKL